MNDELDAKKSTPSTETGKEAPSQDERRAVEQRQEERRQQGQQPQAPDPTADIARKLAAAQKEQEEELKRIHGAKVDRRNKDLRRVAERRKKILGEEEEIKAKNKQDTNEKKLKKRGAKSKKKVAQRRRRRKRRRKMIKKIIGWTVPVIYLLVLLGIIYGVVVFWPQFAKMLK